MVQDNIAREIRAELGRQGVSADWLAKALGWEPSRLYRRLRNQVAWSVEEVAAIASILDVSRSQLLEGRLGHRSAVS